MSLWQQVVVRRDLFCSYGFLGHKHYLYSITRGVRTVMWRWCIGHLLSHADRTSMAIWNVRYWLKSSPSLLKPLSLNFYSEKHTGIYEDYLSCWPPCVFLENICYNKMLWFIRLKIRNLHIPWIEWWLICVCNQALLQLLHLTAGGHRYLSPAGD